MGKPLVWYEMLKTLVLRCMWQSCSVGTVWMLARSFGVTMKECAGPAVLVHAVDEERGQAFVMCVTGRRCRRCGLMSEALQELGSWRSRWSIFSGR